MWGSRRNARPGKTAWVCLRLHRRLHGHGLDACRHGRRICQGRSAAQRARYRCLRHPAQTKAQVLSIARDTAKLVKFGMEIVKDDVLLLERYACPGYGLPSEATKQAIRLCARHERIIPIPSTRANPCNDDRPCPERLPSTGIEGALRASRRRTGHQRVQLHLPQRRTLDRLRFCRRAVPAKRSKFSKVLASRGSQLLTAPKAKRIQFIRNVLIGRGKKPKDTRRC